MEYRMLGSTGLKISAVGFGAWGIGGQMWESDDEVSRKAIREALKRKINFFDTALAYGDGHSERLLGEELEGKEVIIATKVPPKDFHWPARLDSDCKDIFPRQYILKCARKSHENLGRPIDLLQLHVWSDGWINSPEWTDAFEELKAEGIVRFFGVSVNDHAPETALRLAASGKVHALQVIYNVFDQSPAEKLFDICRRKGVGILARVPLDEGSLSGKFTEQTRFTDWRQRYFTPARMPEVVRRVEALRWLEKKGRTLPQAALQFCLAHPAVSTVIPGMRTPQHVAENAQAAESTLTTAELEKLKKHRWDRDFYR